VASSTALPFRFPAHLSALLVSFGGHQHPLTPVTRHYIMESVNLLLDSKIGAERERLNERRYTSARGAQCVAH